MRTDWSIVTGAVIPGAGMGSAFGAGAMAIERGKHFRLSKNQQLRIKRPTRSILDKDK